MPSSLFRNAHTIILHVNILNFMLLQLRATGSPLLKSTQTCGTTITPPSCERFKKNLAEAQKGKKERRSVSDVGHVVSGARQTNEWLPVSDARLCNASAEEKEAASSDCPLLRFLFLRPPRLMRREWPCGFPWAVLLLSTCQTLGRLCVYAVRCLVWLNASQRVQSRQRRGLQGVFDTRCRSYVARNRSGHTSAQHYEEQLGLRTCQLPSLRLVIYSFHLLFPLCVSLHCTRELYQTTLRRGTAAVANGFHEVQKCLFYRIRMIHRPKRGIDPR